MGKKLLKTFTNNIGFKILAIAFAFILWLVVYNLNDPVKTKTFTTTVTVTGRDSVVDKGLWPTIKDSEKTISFSVSGKRSYLNELDDSEGTIKSGSYERVADRYSIDCKFPDEEDKRSLMNIIYGEVKAGEKVDIFEFMRIIGDMKKKGCDAVILGCTELSIIDKDFNLSKKDSKIIDSMEVLARRSIYTILLKRLKINVYLCCRF